MNENKSINSLKKQLVAAVAMVCVCGAGVKYVCVVCSE